MKKSTILLAGLLIPFVILLFISLFIFKMYSPKVVSKVQEQLLIKGIPQKLREIDLSQMVKDELDKLVPGRILFNPAQEMKVGITERVEVRIAKDFTADLSAGFKGRGEPQIEEIKVGTFMKARLSGYTFDIKELSHLEQLITEKGFTQWSWDITPLESGNQSLFLTVSLRIKFPNYNEEIKDYPVFERWIKVKVNPVYSITRFIKTHWQWIIGALISFVGVIYGIIPSIKKKRKGREE